MLRFRASFWVGLVVLVLYSALTPPPVQAQARPGIQGGVSLDPDQVYFGGHIETSPLVDRLRFRPNLDIGLGDNLTLIAFNFEFTYTFPSSRPWNLYAGGGPAMNWLDFDSGSETEAGFNILGGAKHRDGMFFEIKIGVADSPNLKFGVGYTFR